MDKKYTFKKKIIISKISITFIEINKWSLFYC